MTRQGFVAHIENTLSMRSEGYVAGWNAGRSWREQTDGCATPIMENVRAQSQAAVTDLAAASDYVWGFLDAAYCQ